MSKKVLIMVGSAPNVLGDLRGLLTVLAGEYDMMAVGIDAIAPVRGRVQFVVSNHPEDVGPIQRKMKSLEAPDYLMIAPQPGAGVDIYEPDAPPEGRSGSSAMTGVLAALRMGYDRIVLCGCPLTGNAPEGNPYEAFRLGWEDRKNEMIGSVKSMSGWTMELLGQPTEEWLNG